MGTKKKKKKKLIVLQEVHIYMSAIVHRSVLDDLRTSASAGPSAGPAAGQFDRRPGGSPGRCDRCVATERIASGLLLCA